MMCSRRRRALRSWLLTMGVARVGAVSFYKGNFVWMEEDFDAISFEIETRHPQPTTKHFC